MVDPSTTTAPRLRNGDDWRRIFLIMDAGDGCTIKFLYHDWQTLLNGLQTEWPRVLALFVRADAHAVTVTAHIAPRSID